MNQGYLVENGDIGAEERRMAYWAGRAKQVERDQMIVGYVERYHTLTVELVRVLLDMTPTASSRRIVEARLKALTKQRQIKQAKESGICYYLDRNTPTSGSKQKQNIHSLMESTFWITLEKALPKIDEKHTSTKLREIGGIIIPDGHFQADGQHFFLEFDTGKDSNLEKIRSKGERYFKDKTYLEQLYGPYRVLFITKLPGRVVHIVDKLKGLGSGGMFLATHEGNFHPYNPSTILRPIFSSPRDDQLHSLLED